MSLLTTIFNGDIYPSSLSRNNQAAYEILARELSKTEQVLAKIGIDICNILSNETKTNPIIQSIIIEHNTIEKTTKDILETLEPLHNQLTENSVVDKEYIFKNTYTPKNLSKIMTQIQRDSILDKHIALGGWKQYEHIKNIDGINNVDENHFAYINAFSAQGIGKHISFPIEGVQGENMKTIIALITFAKKYEIEKLNNHYNALKKSFMDNIVHTILNAPNKQFMYESFVRTDLLRGHIKSIDDIHSGFNHLVLLTHILDDVKMSAILIHLMQAAFVHKHVDGTNSATFVNQIRKCEDLLGKVILNNCQDISFYNHETFGHIVAQNTISEIQLQSLSGKLKIENASALTFFVKNSEYLFDLYNYDNGKIAEGRYNHFGYKYGRVTYDNTNYIGLKEKYWIREKMNIMYHGSEYTIHPWTSAGYDIISFLFPDNKLALYNTKTKTFITDAVYDKVKSFRYLGDSRRYAAACVDNKRGYINTDGDWVINPQFDGARPFNYSGTCTVYVVSPEISHKNRSEGSGRRGDRRRIDASGNFI